jgi:hypothetical protein
MRSDGDVTYFVVQHLDGRDNWVGTALDEVLFGHLTWDEKGSAKAKRYRALIDPQEASCHIWQKYGIHGFAEEADALAAMQACSSEHPHKQFRTARRRITQVTEVVS